MYEIEKYILEAMKARGLKKSDLVKRMGYKNVAKGIRHLDAFMECKNFNRFIRENLAGALGVPEGEVREVMERTRRELKLEREKQRDIERQNFTPFLFCHTEKRIPSPIFVAALAGSNRMKIIQLPENYNDLPEGEQENIRKTLIIDRMQHYKGTIPAFGAITGFTLKRFFDDDEDGREVYDIQGNPIPNPPPELKKIHKGKATLTLKGRNITPFLQEILLNQRDHESK